MHPRPAVTVTASDIKAALAAKLFEVIDMRTDQGQLRVVGRVPEDKPAIENWFLAVHNLIMKMGKSDWKVDVSKAYSVRSADNKLLYVWRLIFQATNVEQHYPDIVQTLRNAPKSSRVELTSFKLPGASSHRHAGRADYSGKLAVGPQARR